MVGKHSTAMFIIAEDRWHTALGYYVIDSVSMHGKAFDS